MSHSHPYFDTHTDKFYDHWLALSRSFSFCLSLFTIIIVPGYNRIFLIPFFNLYVFIWKAGRYSIDRLTCTCLVTPRIIATTPEPPRVGTKSSELSPCLTHRSLHYCLYWSASQEAGVQNQSWGFKTGTLRWHRTFRQCHNHQPNACLLRKIHVLLSFSTLTW